MIDLTAIELDIRRITDRSYAGHEGWPPTLEAAFLRWVNVIDRATVLLLPASSSRELARTAALATVPAAGLLMLPIAWATYAQTLALGMTGFVALPPVLPINLAGVSALGLSGASAEQCATEIARVIKLWLQTGTAVPSAGGALIQWF